MSIQGIILYRSINGACTSLVRSLFAAVDTGSLLFSYNIWLNHALGGLALLRRRLDLPAAQPIAVKQRGFR